MTAPAPETKVGDVVSTEIYTLTPDTGVVSAARLAMTAGIRHLLVLDRGVLAGVVSASALGFANPKAKVDELMKAPVLCVSPDQTVGECLLIMEQNHVGFLPVVANKFVLGCVTRARLQGKEEPVPAIAVREPD